MAKKIMALGLMLIMVFSLAACGNNASLEKQIGELQPQIEEQDKKIGDLEDENKTLLDAIDGLEDLSKTLSDRVKELEDENKELSDKVDELEKQMQSVALMFVIDRSGSMDFTDDYGNSLMDKAVAAVGQSLDALSDRDYVGIVSFSDSAQKAIDITPVTQKNKIKSAMNGITAAGGTSYAPAIKMACDELSACTYNVGKKHIIFITDGVPDDLATGSSGYNKEIDSCAENNIAFSVVSIITNLFGGDSVGAEMAERGGGFAYDIDGIAPLYDTLLEYITAIKSKEFYYGK